MTRREREELVDGLLMRAWFESSRCRMADRMPGQVVASLSPETRRRLAELTAADFQHRQD